MNLLVDSPFQSVEHAVIWLLIGFSVITWGLALIKGIQFARQRHQDRKFQKSFWSATSLDSAAEQSTGQTGAVARVAQAGFAAIQVQGGQPTDLAQSINHQDRLERSLRQQIQRERRSLESGLAVVASIGSTSPFIGLFGTVWGIKSAFEGIALTQDTSLAVVAPGIAEALFATAIGLVAAIPAVLAYNKINTDLSRYAARLEAFASEFGTILSRQADETPAGR